MSKEHTTNLAMIERGEVVMEVGGKYVVASLDREGIATPPLGKLTDEVYDVGDTVYFFLFGDGTGKIISRL